MVSGSTGAAENPALNEPYCVLYFITNPQRFIGCPMRHWWLSSIVVFLNSFLLHVLPV